MSAGQLKSQKSQPQSKPAVVKVQSDSDANEEDEETFYDTLTDEEFQKKLMSNS